MTAKEQLVKELELDIPGYDITDPRLQSALCLYAERIGNNGYSQSDLKELLAKYLNPDWSRYCEQIVEAVDFYLHKRIFIHVDD